MIIRHLAITPSTMAEARALLAAGDTSTQAVLAEAQTSGRGRLGRVWQTFPAPSSMACTYIVRQECAHLPLLASLAVLNAARQLGHGTGLTIKWPNDLLLNGRKVAGILCEGLNPALFLVGIGLNLQAPPEVPADFPGTFLGTTQTHETFAKTIGACLFADLALYRTQGWAAFHHNYAHACSTFGQPITWRGGAGNQELTGLARGLTQQGHLELVANDGTVHIIPSGEIVAQGSMAAAPSRPTAI
ncbi:MAG: biotin--[acetyl-CoA-carboxylase] ligase [Alphaproteobacteria bacterium]|jgi:BirA family biotin operon repressor/biotin-[acetyl-CoA-carboxylase] ligase|nr:biotin--[acetyl-CoA-carboxylase] ligase [Alphaproteobacteria bacterium]